MRTRRSLLAAAAAVGALSLAACAGGATDGGEAAGNAGATTPAASAEFPITIEHAFGETVIEAQPERVATVGWSNQEAAIALGVVPVIMEAATWGDDDGDGVMPWVETALADMGAETPATYDATEGIDFEAIADATPDVILSAYSGLTQEDYDTLSEIAPVVAYPDVAWGTTWQDMTIMNGTALGLQTEAEALVADLEQQIATAAEQYTNLAGKNALWVFLNPTDLSSLGFYTTLDPRALFLEQIGMGVPAAVTEASDAPDAGFYAQQSAEQVDSFDDVDVIVTYGDQSSLDAAQADPLVSRIPAVDSGAVVLLEDDTPLAASANPSPLGIPFLIEQYLPMIDQAAAQAS